MENEKDYIFECENGKVYVIPYDKKCCLTCKHCESIISDYVKGPCFCFCGCGNECSFHFGFNCNQFELEENTLTVKEYLQNGGEINE